jgi:hypothetical protein
VLWLWYRLHDVRATVGVRREEAMLLFEIEKRRDIVLSQAATALVTAFSRKIRCGR